MKDGLHSRIPRHSPYVDIKNLTFSIDLGAGLGNLHAIVGYFQKIGYATVKVEFRQDTGLTRDMVWACWFVSLSMKPAAEIMIDVLAGKFTDLEKKILEVKKVHYG